MELDNSKLQQELNEIKEKQRNYSGKSMEELLDLYEEEAKILERIVEDDKKKIKEKIDNLKKAQ